MTSTIAIYALLHAVPILLTAYISRSKSSVRTAAVIMAFVAFLGGAFQYVLVDLFVVFVAYVYSFDKWCMDDQSGMRDQNFDTEGATHARDRSHRLDCRELSEEARLKAEQEDVVDQEGEDIELTTEQVSAGVVATVRANAMAAGLDIREELPARLASSEAFTGALLGLIVAYGRAAGYDDRDSRTTILCNAVFALFGEDKGLRMLDFAESASNSEELNLVMDTVSRHVPIINELGSFRDLDPIILTQYMSVTDRDISPSFSPASIDENAEIVEVVRNLSSDEIETDWEEYDRLSGGTAAPSRPRDSAIAELPIEYSTWEQWFDLFKMAAAAKIPQLEALEDGASIFDSIDQEPFKQAFADGLDPLLFAREFAAEFDLSDFLEQ